MAKQICQGQPAKQICNKQIFSVTSRPDGETCTNLNPSSAMGAASHQRQRQKNEQNAIHPWQNESTRDNNANLPCSARRGKGFGRCVVVVIILAAAAFFENAIVVILAAITTTYSATTVCVRAIAVEGCRHCSRK